MADCSCGEGRGVATVGIHGHGSGELGEGGWRVAGWRRGGHGLDWMDGWLVCPSVRPAGGMGL